MAEDDEHAKVKLADTDSKKQMMDSKRGGTSVIIRSDHRSEDPDRVGVQAGASPPRRSLSYVSHFDVLRQHVTRVFTNGGQRRAEAREERKPRTRTCTHIGRETARMRRWPVRRATHTRRQWTSPLFAYDDGQRRRRQRQRGRCGFYVCIMGHVYAPPSGIYSGAREYIYMCMYVYARILNVVYAHSSTFNLPTNLLSTCYRKSLARSFKNFSPPFSERCLVVIYLELEVHVIGR